MQILQNRIFFGNVAFTKRQNRTAGSVIKPLDLRGVFGLATEVTMRQINKLKAFTLSELLVVLVIVGILVLMALPSLMPLISRARGLEAKQQLKHLESLERTYFLEYSRYSDDFEVLGFEQRPLVSDEPPGTANYIIEIVDSNASGFLARATSVTDFDGDGTYNTWEIDQTGNLVETQKD